MIEGSGPQSLDDKCTDKQLTTKSSGANPTESTSLAGKKRKSTRAYTHISDMDRLKLILLITEEKLTCRQAAIRIGIPYTNAKVIHRIFR